MDALSCECVTSFEWATPEESQLNANYEASVQERVTGNSTEVGPNNKDITEQVHS